MTYDIVKLAKEFAIAAHDSVGQKRKYTGDPYWVHPERVAQTVADHGGTPEMIAAAWLHDTVEDTDVTIEDIVDSFGNHVADLVADLTDVSVPSDGNRAIRKAIDKDHSASASAEAQTIKLADLIDNTKSIVKHDSAFAKVYLKEKFMLLTVLTKGHPALLAKAWKLLP